MLLVLFWLLLVLLLAITGRLRGTSLVNVPEVETVNFTISIGSEFVWVSFFIFLFWAGEGGIYSFKADEGLFLKQAKVI